MAGRDLAETKVARRCPGWLKIDDQLYDNRASEWKRYAQKYKEKKISSKKKMVSNVSYFIFKISPQQRFENTAPVLY